MVVGWLACLRSDAEGDARAARVVRMVACFDALRNKPQSPMSGAVELTRNHRERRARLRGSSLLPINAAVASHRAKRLGRYKATDRNVGPRNYRGFPSRQ